MMKFLVYDCHFYFSKYPETDGYKVLTFAFFRWLQKRQLENQARASRGEDPLPEEDINKVFKVIDDLVII